MRARKIYENVGFQRGMEPKEVLGLGLLRSLKAQALADGWIDEGDKWDVHLALLYAIDERKSIRMIEALLDAGADPYGGSSRKGRPLLVAVTGKEALLVVELLLDRGADPYGDGGDVIAVAALSGSIDLMKTLLSRIRKSVKVRAIRKGFYHAARQNLLPMVKYLASVGRIGIDSIDSSLRDIKKAESVNPHWAGNLRPLRDFLESLL